MLASEMNDGKYVFDADFDGIPAIVEAYLNLDPKVADFIIADFDPQGTLNFRRNPTISDLLGVVETSKNLIDFSPLAVNPPFDPLGDIRINFPHLGPFCFWRFNVIRW